MLRSRLQQPVRILVLGLLVSACGAQPAQPGTWRLDYFHTGGLGVEIFSIDRVVVEPLPWSGLRSASTPDPTGAYRFEVRSESGDLLFSQGFSSIFGEWETTAEAGLRNRTFHESLRFPELEATATILIHKRVGGEFKEVWRHQLDSGDIFIDRARGSRLEVLELENSGDPASRADLLFLGDGYTREECSSKFPEDSARLRDVFFGFGVFKTRRSDFNVWGICPPSPESGVSRPSTGRHVASPVGATYDAFGSERYILTFDNRPWREIAASAPYDFVVIMVNDETYGGGGIYNLFSTVAVDNQFADYVFIHELGHHFAGLADEYYTSPVAYQSPSKITEPWEPNATALLDPSRLKWRDLHEEGTPLPTPWPKAEFEAHARQIGRRRVEIRSQNRPESEMSALFQEQSQFESKLLGDSPYAAKVGAFRGANYDAKAFYRPQADCVMFTRNKVPFCAVCRRALNQVIDRLVQ